jgi:hypothetical protein
MQTPSTSTFSSVGGASAPNLAPFGERDHRDQSQPQASPASTKAAPSPPNDDKRTLPSLPAQSRPTPDTKPTPIPMPMSTSVPLQLAKDFLNIVKKGNMGEIQSFISMWGCGGDRPIFDRRVEDRGRQLQTHLPVLRGVDKGPGSVGTRSKQVGRTRSCGC